MTAAAQVRKTLMHGCLPLLLRLRKRGKKNSRRLACGGRGEQLVKDSWNWPTGKDYLFPASTTLGHKTKDLVCHALVKARASFVPPGNTTAVLDVNKIRSHSGRHRAINDLKRSGVDADSAMVYARIKHRRTYDNYGRLDQEQCGKALNQNKRLQGTLRRTYH